MKIHFFPVGILLLFFVIWSTESFSNEIDYEIKFGDVFPSDGKVNLLVQNNKEKEFEICGFKRGGWVIFIAIKKSGLIISDPTWELNTIRGYSHGPIWREILPSKEMKYISNIGKGYLKRIIDSNKRDLEEIFLVGLVKRQDNGKVTIDQSPYYVFRFISNELVGLDSDKITIPEKVKNSVNLEKNKIMEEQDSPDCIYW